MIREGERNRGGLRNIRLVLAYDGTDFCGWQRQGAFGGQKSAEGSGYFGRSRERNRTIQGTIENALERIHKAGVALTGSGRTDAGVHAAGQVANFYTPIQNMAAERFVPALNGFLPQDIRVLEAREASVDFHARFDAKFRTYRYYFICGRPGLPQELRFAHQLWRRPRQDLLNSYARQLLGEQDCSLFAVPRDPSKSRNRYIRGAFFFVQGDTLVFEITANAFLWKMVRSVTGTLLHYEERGLDPGCFKVILRSRDRNLAGPTLPPRGLFLWRIDYYRD